MMFKSTTNIVTILVTVMTSIFILIAMFASIKGAKVEVDPTILAFWSALIGFVVGKKSAKKDGTVVAEERKNAEPISLADE